MKEWRKAAKSAKVPVGEFIRTMMAEVLVRHRRVGVAMGLASSSRLGGGVARRGMNRPKRGG